MNTYTEILKEADEIGVKVWSPNFDKTGIINFDGEHKAHMCRLDGRRWAGYSTNAAGEQIKCAGRKAVVADWCLSQAADGPV